MTIKLGLCMVFAIKICPRVDSWLILAHKQNRFLGPEGPN